MNNVQYQKLKILLTVTALLTTLMSFGQEQDFNPTVLPIKEAIDKRLLN
jgi:hypothetical protein